MAKHDSTYACLPACVPGWVSGRWARERMRDRGLCPVDGDGMCAQCAQCCLEAPETTVLPMCCLEDVWEGARLKRVTLSAAGVLRHWGRARHRRRCRVAVLAVRLMSKIQCTARTENRMRMCFVSMNELPNPRLSYTQLRRKTRSGLRQGSQCLTNGQGKGGNESTVLQSFRL